MKGKIDAERHTAIAGKLAIQECDAVRWKDASLSYFQSLSKLLLPLGVGNRSEPLKIIKRLICWTILHEELENLTKITNKRLNHEIRETHEKMIVDYFAFSFSVFSVFRG